MKIIPGGWFVVPKMLFTIDLPNSGWLHCCMFIRKVIHRNKKKEYTYYRLVENVRIGDKVKQRTILNLGQLNLAKEKHPFLVGRIREYLNGQIPLLQAESEIESLAFYYFQQIRNREALCGNGRRVCSI